jgi:DNA primase
MNKAVQGMREQGFALLAEGYMDVLALQQAKFRNAVASLGTALTKEQGRLLKRYTRRIVICYDSDAAGLKAALRAGEVLTEAGLQVEVLRLTAAKDPDEFIKNYGGEEFQKILKATKTYIEFKYQILSEESPARTIPEKAGLIARLSSDILNVPSPAEREGYERFLGLELGLSLEAVQRELARQEMKRSGSRYEPNFRLSWQENSRTSRPEVIQKAEDQLPPIAAVPRGVYQAEKMLLRLVIDNPPFLETVEKELGEDFWSISEYRQICRNLKESRQNFWDLSRTDPEEKIQSKLANLVLEDIDLSQPERILADCIQVIRKLREEESMTELQSRMAVMEKDGDMEGAMALLKEIGKRLKRGEI